MATKQGTAAKTEVEGETSSRWVYIGFIGVVILLLGLTIFTTEYDVVSGQIVTAIPPPPISTPTPSDFEVVVKIKRIQIVGSDWDGYHTWVTLEVVNAERMFEKGEVYNLKLPIEANTELDVGQYVQFMCDWAYNKELFCNSEYKLVEEQ